MSVVVPVPVVAPTGLRRRVLPSLCASLLAVPLIALPTVAGTALADDSAEPVADAAGAEQAAVEVVEETVAEVEEAVVEQTVVAEPAPAVHDKDTGNVGPVPDDVERPDLVVGLTGPDSGWAGGEAAYTMSVANAATATSPAKGFTVVYTAPPGQTVLSVDAPYDSDWACVLSAEASCSWSGELAVGQAAPPVTVLVGHSRRAVGRLVGTAKAEYLDGEVVLADNTATVVTAMQAPELTLAVGAPDAVPAGEAITMVLSVTNVGPGWISSFALHGEVSDGVVVDSATGTGFDCDVTTLRCDYSDELAPGLSAAVTLTGVVAATHTGGPVTTTGQIDQGMHVARAVTAVAAAPAPAAPAPAAPVGAAPVGAAPPAAPAPPATVPVPVRPVAPVKAIAVMPVTKPVTRVTPRALALPRATSNTAPATLAFTDTPATLPFTGSRGESQLAGGVALLLLGVVLTMGARRRTA